MSNNRLILKDKFKDEIIVHKSAAEIGGVGIGTLNAVILTREQTIELRDFLNECIKS